MSKQTDLMDFTDAKWRLGKLWIISWIILSLFLAAESYSKYDAIAKEVWRWFLLHIALIMISIVAGLIATGKTKSKKIDSRLFKLAYYLGLVYLFMLFAVLLGAALEKSSDESYHWMQVSDYFLHTFQVLAVTANGVFFHFKRNVIGIDSTNAP